MEDNSDIDLAIARVQMAIAESDLRAANAKLKSVNKTRTNYASRSNQTKSFKPNGVSATTTSNFTYSNPVGNRKVDSFRAGERGQAMPNPRANEMRAGERGQGKTAPKKATAPAKPKDTSFKTGGIIPALTSGNAKKFKQTLNKKGILPALRGK